MSEWPDWYHSGAYLDEASSVLDRPMDVRVCGNRLDDDEHGTCPGKVFSTTTDPSWLYCWECKRNTPIEIVPDKEQVAIGRMTQVKQYLEDVMMLEMAKVRQEKLVRLQQQVQSYTQRFPLDSGGKSPDGHTYCIGTLHTGERCNQFVPAGADVCTRCGTILNALVESQDTIRNNMFSGENRMVQVSAVERPRWLAERAEKKRMDAPSVAPVAPVVTPAPPPPVVAAVAAAATAAESPTVGRKTKSHKKKPASSPPSSKPAAAKKSKRVKPEANLPVTPTCIVISPSVATPLPSDMTPPTSNTTPPADTTVSLAGVTTRLATPPVPPPEALVPATRKKKTVVPHVLTLTTPADSSLFVDALDSFMAVFALWPVDLQHTIRQTTIHLWQGYITIEGDGPKRMAVTEQLRYLIYLAILHAGVPWLLEEHLSAVAPPPTATVRSRTALETHIIHLNREHEPLVPLWLPVMHMSSMSLISSSPESIHDGEEMERQSTLMDNNHKQDKLKDVRRRLQKSSDRAIRHMSGEFLNDPERMRALGCRMMYRVVNLLPASTLVYATIWTDAYRIYLATQDFFFHTKDRHTKSSSHMKRTSFLFRSFLKAMLSATDQAFRRQGKPKQNFMDSLCKSFQFPFASLPPYNRQVKKARGMDRVPYDEWLDEFVPLHDTNNTDKKTTKKRKRVVT